MKKYLAIFVAAIMLACLFAGCMGGGNGASAGRETLVIGEANQWWGLDTTLLDGSNFTQGLVADPLVVLDENGNMQPCIASAVQTSEDGKTITLTIPKGMKYASGEEVLPEDVVASLTRFKKVSPFTTNLDPLESMDIDGDNVILHLSEYTSDIAVTLAGSFVTVQDKDVLDSSTDDELLWGAQPYGMYYLTDYVDGSHVELTRNPGYITHNPNVENKGPAHVEKVTVRFISEEFSMANAFNVNDIQAIFDISADGLTQITRDDINVVRKSSIPAVDYLEYNISSPMLTDPKVREALAIAVDRDILVDANKDMVIPAWSINTEKVINHSAEFAKHYKETYGTNIEKAKQLLAEAGWADTDGNGYLDKDGQELKLKIVANDGATEKNTVQSLQIQYKAIGVNLEIEMYTNYYHYDVIYEGKYDIGLEHWGWSEPILTLNMVFTDPQNLIACGANDEYYDIVARASHTPDSDARTKLVYDAEKIISDNVLLVPLYTAENNFVFASDVTGIEIVGNGAVFFNDMK